MAEDSASNLFTRDCLSAINKSFKYAREKKYEYLTIDNLMLFLFQTKNGKKIFDAMKLDFDDYKNNVEEYLNKNINKINNDKERTITTTSMDRLLKSAVKLKNKRGKDGLANEEDILMALFDEDTDLDTYLLKYFTHYDVKIFNIASYIAHGKEKEETDTDNSSKKDESTSYLNKFAINLNEKALAGKIGV